MRGSLCPAPAFRGAEPYRKRDSGRPLYSEPLPAAFPARIARHPRSPSGAGAAAPLAKGSTNNPFEVRMSRVCQVTGKRTTTGNNVSHAMNKTRRRFLPNLHERRFWVASENRWVKLRVSTAAMRTIDKNGIDSVLAELRARGEKI